MRLLGNRFIVSCSGCGRLLAVQPMNNVLCPISECLAETKITWPKDWDKILELHAVTETPWHSPWTLKQYRQIVDDPGHVVGA